MDVRVACRDQQSRCAEGPNSDGTEHHDLLATSHEVSDDNHASAGAVLIDARGNHVVDLRSPGAARRVISLVGLSDLVVVQTDDALLVVPRARSEDVKLVVDALRARGGTDRV